jgi:hypothetical protein
MARPLSEGQRLDDGSYCGSTDGRKEAEAAAAGPGHHVGPKPATAAVAGSVAVVAVAASRGPVGAEAVEVHETTRAGEAFATTAMAAVAAAMARK